MEESCDFPWLAVLPKTFGPRGRHRHERRDATEHRQRILEVAQRLFTEQGVNAVSMHQIAMAAGIGQGTLYRNYAHKGELCMDLLRERHEQFVEEIAALFATMATSPALERLDGVLAHVVAFLEEQGALLSPIAAANARYWLCDEESGDSERFSSRYAPDALPAEIPGHYAGGSERFSSRYAPLSDWLHELFAGLLTEAVARGELAPLDVPYTADAILAALHPMSYRLQRRERGYSPERILQGLRRIYIDGVRTEKFEK